MYTRSHIKNFAVPPSGTPLLCTLTSPHICASSPSKKIKSDRKNPLYASDTFNHNHFNASTQASDPRLYPVYHPSQDASDASADATLTPRLNLVNRVNPVQKFPPAEPEKKKTFPEDEQLMPENEPENILKIQVPFSLRPLHSSRSSRLNIAAFPEPFPHFESKPRAISTISNGLSKNPRHFNVGASILHHKNAAIPIPIGVPLCSVLFRQKKYFQKSRFMAEFRGRRL